MQYERRGEGEGKGETQRHRGTEIGRCRDRQEWRQAGAEVCSAEVCSAEVCSAEVCSAEGSRVDGGYPKIGRGRAPLLFEMTLELVTGLWSIGGGGQDFGAGFGH